MKLIIIITITALLWGGISTAHAQANYTGKWRRNADQSDPGGLSANSIPIMVEIRQDANIITIQSVVKDGKGDLHSSNDTLKMDGSVKTTMDNRTDEKRKSSLIWSADKKHFTYQITIAGTDGAVRQDWKEVFSLTNSGNGLEINVDVTTSAGSFTLKEVFDKA